MSSSKLISFNITLNQLANFLTFVRCFIGFFVILLLLGDQNLLACSFLLAGVLTDALDGWLARKSINGPSEWGARTDPLADKLLLLGPVLWLSVNRTIPIWSVWILFARELCNSAWRAKQKDGGPASIQGKLKTILQFTSIILMIWPIDIGGELFALKLNKIGYILYWPSLIIAITSFLSYLKLNKGSYR